MSDQILTIKSQTLAVIEQITASPKPSYDVDGQEVKWAEYLKQLQATVAWCDEQLQIEAPFEIQAQGFT